MGGQSESIPEIKEEGFSEMKMPEGYDHSIILYNKMKIGFRGLKSKRISLEKCPACGRENYVMNVLTGVCTWCLFNVNNLKDKTYKEILNKNNESQEKNK